MSLSIMAHGAGSIALMAKLRNNAELSRCCERIKLIGGKGERAAAPAAAEYRDEGISLVVPRSISHKSKTRQASALPPALHQCNVLGAALSLTPSSSLSLSKRVCVYVCVFYI